MMTQPKLLLCVAFALLLAPSAQAIDNATQPGACCIQSTSALDAKMNPTKGSDESFFTSAGGPPNILLVLDTSGSMDAWPQPWPSGKGCGHAAINNMGYDKTFVYPSMRSSVTATNTEDDNWFGKTKFYRVNNPSNGLGTNFSSTPSNVTTFTSAALACAPYTSGSDATDCAACIANQGYWIDPTNDPVVAGNFLNFYGPRDSGAVHVLSNIIHDVRDVRMGLVVFNMNTTSNCWGGSSCVCLAEDMGPKCGESFPLVKSSVESNRNSLLSALRTKLQWSGCGTPLADSLYAAGHYLKSKSPNGFDQAGAGNIDFASFATASQFDEKTVSDQKSICASCGFNAIILLTDGEPNNEGNYISLPSEITSQSVTCPSCSSSNLHKVAKYWWDKDLRADFAGVQKVATYTIGFSVDVNNSNLLKRTAELGGGKFYPALSTTELRDAIRQIIDDVASRNTSFSSAAVASVQSGSQGLPAILPRLQPRRNEPWIGRLWRFEQYNEFVKDTDYNADGDKDDIFIIDSAGDIVIEDADGNFIKAANPALLATHTWEGNDRIVAGGLSARKIWTVIDRNNDGAFTDADEPLLEFTAANSATLLPYLAIEGTSFCPSTSGTPGLLLSKLNVTRGVLATAISFTMPGTPTQADLDSFCAKALIQYVRGQDLSDADADGNRTEMRANVLGDIFHSSPVGVDPPVDKFLCDLGLHNQCVRTLYSDALGVTHTPLANSNITNACIATPTPVNAYEAWANENRRRDKVVLVGANDGMVHAFHNGEAGTETCVGGPTSPYTNGTGDELWAFIPPDLLPRLQDQFAGHAYYVDGDVMVRDIWSDGSGGATNDNIKQKEEFHTMAVISEGRGGTHYLGLELKFTSAGNLEDKPSFRWMFPQPCSEEASTFGKTFYALAPKPPPIGPVLLQRDTVPGAPTTGTLRDSVDTIERWIVALSGGWSPSLERGRGIYFVDAYRGMIDPTKRKDNLLWKMEFDDDASSNQLAPLKGMTHSISAPVALVDFGDNSGAPRQDGFFDTAVVGDTGGRVWVARFHKPGTLKTSAPFLATNWAGGRSFETDRDGTIVSAIDPLDPPTGDAKSTANDNQFFYLPSVALEPSTSAMRVFIGSGNRYALLERNAGTCRFDNPTACAKYGCDEVKTVYKIKKNTHDISKMENHWKSRRYEHGKLDVGSASQGMCGPVTAEFGDFKVNSCNTNLAGGSEFDPGDVNKVKYTCGLNAASTSFTCSRDDSNLLQTGDLFSELDSKVSTTGLGKNRFFGFWAYGGQGGKTFDETGATASNPKTYDAARITDRTSSSTTSGDLVNVTNVTCTAAGACSGEVGDGGYGWVYEYPALETKTATGAAVLAGCVLWSSLSPTTLASDAGAVCGALANSQSAIFQADFITGYPDCAAGFKATDGGVWSRSSSRNVVAPPPEPASTIQISSTGEVRYSAMIVEPGKGQATTSTISAGQDVLQAIYELPISRTLHECRHTMDGGCVTIP